VGNGQIEFTGGEVKHGDEILVGTETSGLTFHGREDAIEAFHKSIGGAVNPMPQDAFLVAGDHGGAFTHVGEERS